MERSPRRAARPMRACRSFVDFQPFSAASIIAVIAVWLWLTVLFSNLAESVAEGRVVNEIRVKPEVRHWANVALQRMLSVGG